MKRIDAKPYRTDGLYLTDYLRLHYPTKIRCRQWCDDRAISAVWFSLHSLRYRVAIQS